MNRVLALGEKSLTDEDLVRSRITKRLTALNPSVVFSDLAPGWNLLVAEEAQRMAIPTQGVFPFAEIIGKGDYKPRREAVEKGMRARMSFHENIEGYLNDPQPYFDWLALNVDSVLAYVNPSLSSTQGRLMVALRGLGKTVFNVF